MTAHMTADEMFESLTGFEEIAIARAFDAEVTDLADRKPLSFLRSLVFVALTRTGKTAPDAKQEALGMSIRDVNRYFAEEDPGDVDPANPESDSGKDDGLPG